MDRGIHFLGPPLWRIGQHKIDRDKLDRGQDRPAQALNAVAGRNRCSKNQGRRIFGEPSLSLFVGRSALRLELRTPASAPRTIATRL